MNRWLVFRGDTYYPMGGWGDFFGSFEEPDIANRWAAAETGGDGSCRWGHVVDRETGVVVSRFGQHLGGAEG